MALYNEIGKRDIVMMARDLLEQGILVQRDVDGKLELRNQTAAWETPWHHTVHDADINCYLWNTVMYQHMFKKAPYYFTGGGHTSWVPTGCMDCYKVVVRLPTLKSLFAMVDLQKRLDKPAKCGIELRDYVHGNYGAYFYNRGLDEGLERYKEVRQAVNDDPLLGPDVKVILKRSCTEMEMAVGASDKWELTPEQITIEKLIHANVNCDNQKRTQSRAGINYVHGKWIRHAYAIGDETVFEYLDPDKPLYKPLVTYHHLAEGGA